MRGPSYPNPTLTLNSNPNPNLFEVICDDDVFQQFRNAVAAHDGAVFNDTVAGPSGN